MGRVTKIILPAIVLTGILALILTSGSGCGGKSTPIPAMSVYYDMGQTAQTSREVMTVVSSEMVTKYKKPLLSRLSTTYNVAPPGTVFYIIEVSVTNVGQESLSISYKDFSIKDSLGHVWPCIGYNGTHKAYPSRKLASGQSDYGYIAFNVLDTATGLELTCVLQGSPPVLGVWQLPY